MRDEDERRQVFRTFRWIHVVGESGCSAGVSFFNSVCRDEAAGDGGVCVCDR